MTMTNPTAAHDARRAARARNAFVKVRGLAATQVREAEIARLPRVDWKGRPHYTLRCHGMSGKGPHDVNVPEALCWALIDLRAFRCPYHKDDLV